MQFGISVYQQTLYTRPLWICNSVTCVSGVHLDKRAFKTIAWYLRAQFLSTPCTSAIYGMNVVIVLKVFSAEPARHRLVDDFSSILNNCTATHVIFISWIYLHTYRSYMTGSPHESHSSKFDLSVQSRIGFIYHIVCLWQKGKVISLLMMSTQPFSRKDILACIPRGDCIIYSVRTTRKYVHEWNWS